MATPEAPVSYTSVDGDQLTLFPWVGEHVAVLTASGDLDGGVMDAALGALDGAYEVYFRITGRAPEPRLTYDGRLSIAEVPIANQGNAAAVGYLGQTGIEITTPFWNIYYNGVADFGLHDQPLFYELGRNFWFYGDQLEVVDAFVTGFAITNRFVSMEVAGVPGLPARGLDFPDLQDSVLEGLAATFFGGAQYSFANTLEADAAPANTLGLGAADFAGALLYRVYDDLGLDAYSAFYAALANRPAAATPADAYANLIAAASEATGIDYSFLNKPEGVAYVVGSSEGEALTADGVTPVLAFGGADTVTGSDAADRIFAGAGDDVVAAGQGGDLVVGGGGADTLSGEAGRDTLMGGEGNDWLRGGAEADELTGGPGADRFRLQWEETGLFDLFRNGGHPGENANDRAWEQYDRQAERAGFTFPTGSFAGHTLWARQGEGAATYRNLDGVDTITDFNLEEGDRLHFEGVGDLGGFMGRISATDLGDVVDLSLDGEVFLRVRTEADYSVAWIQ